MGTDRVAAGVGEGCVTEAGLTEADAAGPAAGGGVPTWQAALSSSAATAPRPRVTRSSDERSGVSGHVDRVLKQQFERHDVERSEVG